MQNSFQLAERDRYRMYVLLAFCIGILFGVFVMKYNSQPNPDYPEGSEWYENCDARGC